MKEVEQNSKKLLVALSTKVKGQLKTKKQNMTKMMCAQKGEEREQNK